MIVTAVDAEVIEPEVFGDTVEPILLGNLVAGVVLRGANGQVAKLRESGLASGGVSGLVALDQLGEKVGALEESVQVTGASPIVDVTSTGTSSSITSKRSSTRHSRMVSTTAARRRGRGPHCCRALSCAGSAAVA